MTSLSWIRIGSTVLVVLGTERERGRKMTVGYWQKELKWIPVTIVFFCLKHRNCSNYSAHVGSMTSWLLLAGTW